MEKHLRVSPVFEAGGTGYAYVPCTRDVYNEYFLKAYPKEVEFMERCYSIAANKRTTEFPTEVTCPKCKESWEYIEESIRRTNERGR